MLASSGPTASRRRRAATCIPPQPGQQGFAGPGRPVQGSDVVCAASRRRWQPHPDLTSRLRAPVCPQRRNQGHIAAECLAAPRRFVYDESSRSARRSAGATPGAVVRANHCWGRPALRRRRLPARREPLSLEYYGSTPGQQPTPGASGAMVAQPVRHGSAAWLAKSTATGGLAPGERLAYPTAGVVCPRP